MKWILLKIALRDSLRRPWLTGLMLFRVAVGVAVVVAIDLANASAARAFNPSSSVPCVVCDYIAGMTDRYAV